MTAYSPTAFRTRLCTPHAAEVIGRAVDLVPPRVLEHAGGLPEWWEGEQLGFAGLWDERWPPESETRDATARYFPEHPRRRSTIVVHTERWAALPRGRAGYGVEVVLHEIGHFVWDRLIRANERDRVYHLPEDPSRIRVTKTSGLVPSMRGFTGYCPRDMGEQWAEAFRIWLAPRWALAAQWEPEQFYLGPSRAPLDDWGVRTANERVLAFLNELAGFPFDAPPRALR